MLISSLTWEAKQDLDWELTTFSLWRGETIWLAWESRGAQLSPCMRLNCLPTWGCGLFGGRNHGLGGCVLLDIAEGLVHASCFGAVREERMSGWPAPSCCLPSLWFILARIFLFLLLIHCLCSVTQSCPILCDPMDCSPPGYSVHGILQARILEWIAIFLLQGIFLSQESNPHLLHWQAYSLPLSHQGSPESVVLIG